MFQVCPFCNKNARKHPDSRRCVRCYREHCRELKRQLRAKPPAEATRPVGRPQVIEAWANDLSSEYLRMKL
jgi:hypothetical protein